MRGAVGAAAPARRHLDAVRDLDLIRAALGERRLHYFGVSYGTWLGGGYAHRFPARVGRAVLDGAVDTGNDPAALALGQAAGFQQALGEFAAACARLGRVLCPLGKDGPSAVASIGRILAASTEDRSARRPAAGSPRARHDRGRRRLYSRKAWPYLAQGLSDAVKRRDGSLLLLLADLQNGRRGNGVYSNFSAANTAITCADGADRYTADDVRELLPRFRAASPIFGRRWPGS